MKYILEFLYCFVITLSVLPVASTWGQAKLDIEGNAKMRGRLELSYPFDTTSLAIGEGAGASEDTSDIRHNTFAGYYAGFSNTTGKQNTVNGAYALYYNQTGNHQTALGYLSLYWTGFNSMVSNYNTAAGALALTNTTTGYENSALGYRAGYSNTTGRWNTFIGSQAGRDFETGDNNVFIGQASRLEGKSGDNNVVIGRSAARENSGSNNVVVGDDAARTNTGNGNVILGFEAAKYLVAGGNTLWIENSSATTPLIYGDFFNDKVGINCASPAAALSVIGDIKAVGSIESSQATACSSDLRLKKHIRNLESVFEKVKALRPVRYDWRKEEFPDQKFAETPQIGFIAQDIEQLFPEVVFTDKTGFKSMDYSRMVVILIEALQEITLENQKLNARYQSISDKIAGLYKDAIFQQKSQKK